MSIAEIKTAAAAIAKQMKALGAAQLPSAMRKQFIEVRAALIQLGVYDPILVRFDSATVAQASVAEVAAELEKIASSL